MDNTKPTGRSSQIVRRDRLLDACIDGLADGLRIHIPAAVGIVLKAAALCVSLALAHILLEVPMAVGGVGAGTAALVHALPRALRFLRDHDFHG